MPLHYHKYINPVGELGIWKIQEDENFFLDNLELEQEELHYYSKIKGHLKLEWLASRYLLHKMTGRVKRGLLIKDEYGKPSLENSMYHISLSHSFKMAAVAGSPTSIGIDIQKILPKIRRIAPKFMNEAEFSSLKEDQLLHMHIYWGAKECLYKSYGKRKLDFKKHILIEPFELKNDFGEISGQVVKENYCCKYEIFFQKLEDYLLVHSLEIK